MQVQELSTDKHLFEKLRSELKLMTFPRNSAQCAWLDGVGSGVIDHTDTIVAEQSHLCKTAPCKHVPLDNDFSGRLNSNTSTIKCFGMDPDWLWPDKPPLPTESSAKVQSAFGLPRQPTQHEHVPEPDTAVVRLTEGLARKVAGHAASIQELRLEISNGNETKGRFTKSFRRIPIVYGI